MTVPPIPPRCVEWLDKWLGADPTRTIIASGEPWTTERLVAWAYTVVDIAVREVVSALLEQAGSPLGAAQHRALEPIRDTQSAREAVEVLEAWSEHAERLKIRFHFFRSTIAAVEETMQLDGRGRSDCHYRNICINNLFWESGALDMACYRGIASGLPREHLIELYRSKLLETGKN